MRGRQESRQLKWGDFTRKTDEWGNEFLEFNERTTKTRQGLGDTRPFHPKMWANCRNPERCPLYLYKEYERHRPYDMREPEFPFYLGVNFKRALSAECWFQRQPMGKKSLGTMMKVTAEKVGIKGKFTNHSTRRTSISQLMAHEVPPVVVAQLRGHKNIQSIMRYSTASRAQQEGMFKVLTNSGEYHNRALPSSAAAAPALHAALPQVSLLNMYVHVVLCLLGLKKKKNPCVCSPRSPWFEKKITQSLLTERLWGQKKTKKKTCVCSPRSPWFEKKKKKIHVYVVLGLLGLKKKKKKIHVYVVLGLLGLKKKKIHIHVLQGEAPETQRFTRPTALCCPPPAVLPSAAPQKRPASAALGAAPSTALSAAPPSPSLKDVGRFGSLKFNLYKKSGSWRGQRSGSGQIQSL